MLYRNDIKEAFVQRLVVLLKEILVTHEVRITQEDIAPQNNKESVRKWSSVITQRSA